MQAAPLGNRLLAAMPPDEYARVARLLDLTVLEPREPLIEPDARPLAVWFPLDGAILLSHEEVPIALIGADGLVGLSELLAGDLPSPFRATTMTRTRALQSGLELGQALPEVPSLWRALDRYAASLLALTARAPLCPAAHPPRGRIARWMLDLSDLGLSSVQRSVLPAFGLADDQAVSSLVSEGLLLANDELRVADRSRLEREVCRCYALARRVRG